MAPLEYLAVAIDDWHVYAVLLFASLALHGVLIRRWVMGLFDPLLLLLLTNAFSWTIVWFMFLRDDIAGVYVVSFTLAELGLYAGVEIANHPATKAAPAEVVVIGLTLDFFADLPDTLSAAGAASLPTLARTPAGPAPPLLHDLFHIACLFTN